VNTGRVVVITGVAGGVGALLVKRFADNGDTVVATDANADALERLRDGRPHSGKLIVESADISSEEDCRRLAESARQLGGPATVSASAEVLKEPLRSQIFAEQAARYPSFASYQARTSRQIAVIALTLTAHASQPGWSSQQTPA
jgi:NAD(P)-dependent dehydrogenase (short-subunit alcohol dehydrogenase family)